jgi:hypothetical protein
MRSDLSLNDMQDGVLGLKAYVDGTVQLVHNLGLPLQVCNICID